jgi:nitroreductase
MNEDVLDVIRRRRTIRKFTDEDVSEEQVETLLEMAMCAPSRLDRQPWHFVVIRDKGLQKQLADLLRIHPYLETAPVVIAVCGLPKASPTWIMDVSAATENMLLAATAMGLGAAWVGSPDTIQWGLCEETLHDALAIPLDDVRIPTLVAVGHPAPKAKKQLRPHGKHDRFDRTKVHYGKWGELRLEGL